MKLTRRRLTAALASVLCAPAAFAQPDYPSKPIRIVVPYASGGGTDAVARVVAKAMTTHLGQTVLVDNKPGSGTAIGAAEVARAAPDGYTLLWGDNTTFALNPFLYKKLPYAPLEDFAPISLTLRGALVLVVSPSLGVNSVPELLAYIKARPGKLQYGSAGNGTPHHLAMEALKLKAGLDILHVPYKGEGPGLNDVLGGQTQLMFVGTTIAKQHAESGRIKLIATAGGTRNPVLPQVPTVAEGGVAGFDASYWHALVAPAKTPDAALQKVHQAYAKATRDPEVLAYLAKAGGSSLSVSTPQELRAHMQEQTRIGGELIKAINLTMD
ncbi:MAG: tripartite tricarboxylate transporter substrate binding protein [Burkholderiaceae bacterium]|nr:tripartite tricarboxylate transporter substrate binding protein [Burkholderiaceae bacterium]